MAAARAERGRIERGKATMELTLALGRPDLVPRAPVTLRGFKDVIDATDWLVVKLTHTLGDSGLTTRLELKKRVGLGILCTNPIGMCVRNPEAETIRA
ncbi:hypothetical protein [Paracidovorax anthurii]|uniref:Uncharacterized protein n=1 Tax=Paracidovorax anthurii TaxID=78229 RepID=A0A328YYR1_9BURK|nr:hypothetical protein AX018_10332 [Paracidovorax anthurii]